MTKNITEQYMKENKSDIRSMFISALIADIIGIITILLSVYYFKQYNDAIFVILPVCIPLIATLIHARKKYRKFSECFYVSFLTLGMVGIFLLFMGFEGIICLMMALPLAACLALIGGSIGYYTQRFKLVKDHYNALLIIIFLTAPSYMGFRDLYPKAGDTIEVSESIIINTDSQKVWNSLTSFPSLSEPDELFFKAGIAYPKTASIDKKGKGGTITWNFTTGDVKELVTEWKENEKIAYKITKEPEMMHELSLYDIHPPHLKGYFKSENGYFKIQNLGKGKSMLTGYTCYKTHMWPAFYWTPQANYLHKQVQQMVLKNIKSKSEGL